MLMTKSYNHSNPTPLKKKKPHMHTPSMYLNELNRKQYPLRNSKKNMCTLSPGFGLMKFSPTPGTTG
jgi:hypothetical protein